MKSIFLRTLIFLFVCLAACSGKEDLDFCTDPIGTDTYSLGPKGWVCFLPEINGCFIFESTTSSTITSIGLKGHVQGTIADIGTVKCLGGIADKPSTGFVSSTEVKANHGYVVKFPDNTYGRFFVVSVDKNSSGQVTNVNITRQYRF
jgi:hypothetical protein